MPAVTALGDYFREQAAAHRATALKRPDDPRFAQSADALDGLAGHADRAAEEELFQMRFLLEHHIVDGTFAWPTGQSGRTIARYGFDQPVRDDPMEREIFLMDLCDLAKMDATRHIGSHEQEFDRADVAEIAKRYGLSEQLVHHALDTGRGYFHLFVVAIPHWHELSAEAHAKLEAMDGVKLMRGRPKDFPEEDQPPLLACNVVADDEPHAREIVAQIAGIEADALGVKRTERIV
jgi:hypothetical protein